MNRAHREISHQVSTELILNDGGRRKEDGGLYYVDKNTKEGTTIPPQANVANITGGSDKDKGPPRNSLDQ